MVFLTIALFQSAQSTLIESLATTTSTRTAEKQQAQAMFALCRIAFAPVRKPYRIVTYRIGVHTIPNSISCQHENHSGQSHIGQVFTLYRNSISCQHENHSGQSHIGQVFTLYWIAFRVSTKTIPDSHISDRCSHYTEQHFVSARKPYRIVTHRIGVHTIPDSISCQHENLSGVV